jgi:A/G-specific adenine glycosylase
LPAARPKKAVPTRRTWMLVLRDGPSVLLEKRPPSGIWGGLWSLPEAADEASLAERAHILGAQPSLTRLAPIAHTFTHFKLDIEPRCGELRAVPPTGVCQALDGETAWVPLESIDDYGVPAPVRKLLDALDGPLL